MLPAHPLAAMRDEVVRSGNVWSALGSFGVRGVLPHALARSQSGELLAVGDEAGVTWWHGGRRERAALPLVRDLVFDAADVLWIATAMGLYRWTERDRPQLRKLPGGENANRIHRLAAHGSALLLATEAGAYWSSDGRVFQVLPLRGTASRAIRVAIRPASFDSAASVQTALPPARRAQAWVYGSGRLSVVRGIVREGGLRVTDVREVDPPRLSDDRLPMDLVIDPTGQRLFMVFEDLVAWRTIELDDAVSTASSWRLERPVMPPGARIRRLAWAAGRVWLATDHGLLEAAALEGPFRRSASPMGTSQCADLQSRGNGGAVALCRQGLFVLGPAGEPLAGGGDTARPEGRDPFPPDPPVAEIRRRALERAGLSAARSERLWTGLARRAFWPELSLRFGVDSDRDRRRDADESFLSGEKRFLLDKTRDEGRSYDASIELDWDLGGVVYPSESVDLSRELRQVVSLRDDVSDEIHQLYFERQSIRERLAAGASLELGEAARLRDRASEIEAGLDAWTGGWLSRWRGTRAAEQGGSEHHASGAELQRFDFDSNFNNGPDHPTERERK
jgi:hypothetical protein